MRSVTSTLAGDGNACGGGATPTRAPRPVETSVTLNTPTSETGSGDALPTVVAITEDTSTQSLNCGDIDASGKPLRARQEANAQAAAACFMSSLAVCQPAVLTVRETDAGVLRQFSISGTRRNCVIRQAFQPDANSAPAVADCENVEIADAKLEITNCSHLGDFILSLGN